MAIALLGVTGALAQSPPSPAPNNGTPTPSPPVIKRAVPTAADGAGCNTVEKPISAGGASIAPETAGQNKRWQPPGGEISFTVRSFIQIPADALVIVCFRWKRVTPRQDEYINARAVHLDLSDSGRLLKVTVVVPPTLRNPPSRSEGEYAGLSIVPLADVRILVVGRAPDGSFLVAADVSHEIGVTNPWWAIMLALLTVVLAFGILTIVGYRRLKPLDYHALDPFIRIITTRNGYASLSQLQMVVWTVVVAASAVYVMVLSGELIEITTGTLVLLGISGTVTIASALTDSTQSAKAAPAAVAAPPRRPRWSDLIVNEVDGQREIDISRVQMLYFTLVTATFVVMRVLASYVIPEIPESFQILMGISNAVYIGSKVAQPATAAATAPSPPPTSQPPAQS